MCDYKRKYGCNPEGIKRMKKLENELTAMTKERDKLCDTIMRMINSSIDEPIGYTVTTMVTHG